MVAGNNRPEEIDPGGVRKLLHLLDALRDTPSGSIIYRQVKAMLDDIAANKLKTEMAYAGFVGTLLEAFAAKQAPGSPRYVQLKLLQVRLQPPLTLGELETLGEFIDECAQQIEGGNFQEAATLSQAIDPLLRAFGIDVTPAEEIQPSVEPQVPETSEAGDAEPAQAVVSPPPEVAAGEIPAAEQIAAPSEEMPSGEWPGAEAEAVGEEEAKEGMPPAMELGEDYRNELEARREDIQKLQATLGQQVVETITQNEEFGEILDSAIDELHDADDMEGVENIRWAVIREIEKLMKGHNELADKLDNTHHYLQLIESDSRELTDELTRVRLLSLTDELTSLPNRRAFMRRLEDEVARVQRYGFPLSFALMDLDHFKEINDEYGHAAGDEVLRVYSKNILSVFRHHDMVARYGGEEFAVLLPNTDADGAIRALNKVKRRAAETRWQCNGAVVPVPSFSAGVSLFKPGESASAFIERADKALYRAKRLGRDRIELDITYETEERERTRRRRSTDV
ncbi:MAG: diguanylate cyclase [Gammaproteobacteria bacterium]|nr:MAG: diguanylate cyclase [Gammaproteobacteria bacterium]